MEKNKHITALHHKYNRNKYSHIYTSTVKKGMKTQEDDEEELGVERL